MIKDAACVEKDCRSVIGYLCCDDPTYMDIPFWHNVLDTINMVGVLNHETKDHETKSHETKTLYCQ